jgi:RNA polymerase sigma factor (sigma-70 family)
LNQTHFSEICMNKSRTRRKRPRPEDYLYLVAYHAKKYVRGGAPVEDTEEYSIGCMALVDVAKNYDGELSEFPCLASCAIRNAIIDDWREKNRKIRKPKNLISFDSLSPSQQEEVTKNERNGHNGELSILISRMLRIKSSDTKLQKRDKRILVLYYLKGMTFSKIGHKFSLTKQGAQVAVKRALMRLRKHQELKDFT